MRRIIINADDLGLTEGVNRGILDCWRRGIVTSTTAMVSGTAFGDAIACLKQALPGPDSSGPKRAGSPPSAFWQSKVGEGGNGTVPAIANSSDFRIRSQAPQVQSAQIPSAQVQSEATVSVAAVGQGAEIPAAQPIGVGCHIVLVDGAPVLPVEQISTLVDTRSGRFRPSFGTFACAALSGRLEARQIEAEATAQIRRLLQTGVSVTHIDAHKHVHMLPGVLRPVLRAAGACKIRAVRNPFAPARPLPYAQLLRRPFLWKRLAEVMLLRFLWCSEFRRAVAESGMRTTDGTLGIVVTGEMDAALLQAIADGVPDGTWELCCHPGYNDSELGRAGTRLLASRERELELMTSGFARDLLARQGVELITYRDL